MPLYLTMVVIEAIDIDGLMQERRNSIANALELRLSCIDPSIWYHPNLIMNCTKHQQNREGLSQLLLNIY